MPCVSVIRFCMHNLVQASLQAGILLPYGRGKAVSSLRAGDPQSQGRSRENANQHQTRLLQSKGLQE